MAPKPFTDKSGQDAEAWQEYFERYINFRKLRTPEKQELMGTLMHKKVADWMTTLQAVNR
jgi:hypothetical protein